MSKTKKSNSFFVKLFLVIVVLVFAAVIGLNQFKAFKKAEFIANMPERANAVTAIKLEPKSWQPVIETSGIIKSKQGALLSSQSMGQVKSIFVKSGQSVTKGQLLVSLDSSVEEANLNALEAEFIGIKTQYESALRLYNTKSIAKNELDNATAKYNAKKASIEATKASIKRRSIVAPFDGTIGIIKVDVGQYVNTGMPIVQIEDNSLMRVQFSISQNNLEKVYIGQTLDINVDTFQDRKYTGKITALDSKINQSSGLVDIEAVLNNHQGLISGMFARIAINLPIETNKIVVPQIAISYAMYGENLFKLEPLSDEDREKLKNLPNLAKMYRSKLIDIKTIDRNGIEALISANDSLKIGDVIVTGGQQNLSNNSLVEVKDKEIIGLKPIENLEKL